MSELQSYDKIESDKKKTLKPPYEWCVISNKLDYAIKQKYQRHHKMAKWKREIQ